MTISTPSLVPVPVRAGTGTAPRRADDLSARRTGLSSAAAAALVILVAGVAVAAAVFFSGGGRWFVVSTASMGEAAPVGTLVLTQPVAGGLSVGEIITFRPPTAPEQVYTHRIDAMDAGGLLSTRGDANGTADPWELSESDVIGRAVAVLPGVGHAIRALPLLAIGLAGLWALTARFVRPDDRSAARVLGASFVVSVTVFLLKPLVGVAILATAVENGSARATVVSTGLLPIRATVTGGSSVDLTSGMVGTLSAPVTGATDRYDVTTALHLPPAGWLVMGLVCALPLLWCLIVGLPARTGETRNA
ncbi:S26 family signal peptidase [Planctomonas deserti]|uniref:S26 family signal peptidase n=1 Tax=Planctomonas deserti TaxID=2144185 RepID=UPI000D36B4F1|nr:S26 family signal peptidase [Planctomonas deserti]